MSSARTADVERFRSGVIFVVVSQETDIRCSFGSWYNLWICLFVIGAGPPHSRGF